MFCSQCGKKINENSKFCKYCGGENTAKTIEIPVPYQPKEPGSLRSNPATKNKLPLIIGGLTIMLYIILYICAFGGIGESGRIDDVGKSAVEPYDVSTLKFDGTDGVTASLTDQEAEWINVLGQELFTSGIYDADFVSFASMSNEEVLKLLLHSVTRRIDPEQTYDTYTGSGDLIEYYTDETGDYFSNLYITCPSEYIDELALAFFGIKNLKHQSFPNNSDMFDNIVSEVYYDYNVDSKSYEIIVEQNISPRQYYDLIYIETRKLNEESYLAVFKQEDIYNDEGNLDEAMYYVAVKKNKDSRFPYRAQGVIRVHL